MHYSYGLQGLCPLLSDLLSVAGVISSIVSGRVKTGDQEHAAEGLPVIGIPFHPFHIRLLMSVTLPATVDAIKYLDSRLLKHADQDPGPHWMLARQRGIMEGTEGSEVLPSSYRPGCVSSPYGVR